MPALHPHFFDLAKDLECNVFIESGTFMGITYRKAVECGYFERVYSVELVKNLYERASGFYKDDKYRVFWGKSYEVLLKDIFPICNSGDRIFFFLDGHYSSDNTGGSSEPCPLILELESIEKGCPTKSIIIAIDDTDDLGRFDQTTPGFNWPTRDDIEKIINQINPEYYVLDYSGTDRFHEKVYRGMLIYAYRKPSEYWMSKTFRAIFSKPKRQFPFHFDRYIFKVINLIIFGRK